MRLIEFVDYMIHKASYGEWFVTQVGLSLVSGLIMFAVYAGIAIYKGRK